MKDNSDATPAKPWTGKSATGTRARLEPPDAESESPKPAAAPPPAEGYAVYLFPAAIEALGEIIAPYLSGDGGGCLLCREVDTGGALVEMELSGAMVPAHAGIELMLPTGMVRMIVSARSDDAFGFNRKPGLP